MRYMVGAKPEEILGFVLNDVGDTLFVGGVGRFFEGTPDQMLDAMDKLGTLPDDSLVCCAHEYTLGNFRFLASVDAPRCQAELEAVQRKRNANISTVPSRLGDEKRLNLFMRCRHEETQGLVGVGSAVDAMRALRERKNAFK